MFYGFFREEFSSKTRKNIDYHLIFDNHTTTLRRIIQNLKNSKDFVPFPLAKLFHFAKTLIQTLAFLQTLKLCQRDIKPERFLLDEGCNNIFVIDFHEYEVMKYFDARVSNSDYLSPELKKIYNDKNSFYNIDVFRSEVFSLGLVVLELGVLHLPERNNNELTYLANIESTILKLQLIYEKIALKDGLSKEFLSLVNILKRSLHIYSSYRPDFIGLFWDILVRESQNNAEKIRKMISID